MKSFVLKTIAISLACIMLTSCGSKKTLESVMTTESAVKEVADVRDKLLSEQGDVYSDYEVVVSGNDIIYKYYYISDYSDEMLEIVKEALETDSTWSDTVKGIKDEIEQTSLIRPDTVTFAYYSFDGREIFKVTE